MRRTPRSVSILQRECIVVDFLLHRGHSLRALVRPQSPRRAHLARKTVEIVSGDLLSPSSLVEACANQDIIVNRAGLVTDWAPAKEFYRQNVLGVAILCQAILKGELVFWRKNSRIWPCYVGNLLHIIERVAFYDRAVGKGFLVYDGLSLSFRRFTALIAGAIGSKPPRLRLPYALVYLAAGALEFIWRLRGIKTRPLLTTYTIKNFGARLLQHGKGEKRD